MAADLVPIEIFAPGTYQTVVGTDITLTAADLDRMVANFTALQSFVKPPLKLGHSTSQIVEGQSDGDPALGWVAALSRVGDKLVAYVADMPRIVRDAIKAKRYRRVSAEFLLDWGKTAWERNLKTGVTGPVLDGVALLGADLPQVANLADLDAYMSQQDRTGDSDRFVAALDVTDETVVTLHVDDSPTDTNAEGHDMSDALKQQNDDIAALKAALDEQRAELARVKAEANTAIASVKDEQTAKIAELTAELAQAKDAQRVALAEKRETEATAFAERMAAKDTARILPAQKPWLAQLYRLCASVDGVAVAAADAERLRCTVGDKAADLTATDVLEQMLLSGPTHEMLYAKMVRDDTSPSKATDYEAALSAVAKRENLNLSVPAERWKAAQVVAREQPEVAGLPKRAA